MCRRVCLCSLLCAVTAGLIGAEPAAPAPTNLALGRRVVTLPVLAPTADFYGRITDGKVETVADWGGNWSDHTFVVIDLEQADYVDEVRIYSGTTSNYAGAWCDLKPHFAVYAGESLDRLQFLAERKPYASFDAVSLADAQAPFVSFADLRGYGRYVAVFVRHYSGMKLNEVEVLKNSGEHAPQRPQSTMSLEELWLRDASLSGWLPMSTEVVTPHVAWCRPAAAGTLKALFFMHKGQFRDIAELEQRLDLTWDWQPIIWNSSVDQPEVPALTIVEEQRALGLLAQAWDVIMLGASVKWSDLPASVRAAILAKVQSGTGLIYSNPLQECLLPDMAEVLAGLRTPPDQQARLVSRFALDKVRLMKPLPPDMLALGQHGKGQVARLAYTPFLTRERLNFAGSAFLPEFAFYKAMPEAYENVYAFLVDLMYTVSARKPTVRIAAAQATDAAIEVTLAQEALPDRLASGLTLQCELRDKNYDLCGSVSRPASAAAGAAIRIPLAEAFPSLRKGENLVNLWLKDMYGKTLDFCVASVPGTHPGIKAVETAPAGYTKAGGPLTVVLDSAAAGDRLTAEAHDAYGRLIWTATQAVAGDRVPFTMTLTDARSTGVILAVSLKNQDRVVDVVKKPVPCGLGNFSESRAEFGFDVWGEAPFHFNKPWMLHALKQQREVGVELSTAFANYYGSQKLSDEEWDAVLDEFFGTFAVNGIRPFYQYSAGVTPYLARGVDNRLWKPADESRMVLGDRAFVSQYVGHVQRNAAVTMKWGVDTYVSGDEQQGWMSYAPQNVAAFQEWMKEAYRGEIGALNRNWGTAYTAFTDVKPAELGNISEALARAAVEQAGGVIAREAGKDELKAGDGDEIYTFAPWLEYRLFMDKLFADIHGETLRAVQQLDRRYRFGIEGTRYAGMIGFDWPYLLKNVNYVTCYDEPVQAEIIRSYQGADCRTASWVGYDTHDRDELWAYMRPWINLIRGLSGISYYESSGYRGHKDWPHHRFGLVAEDLRLSNSGRIYAGEVAAIGKGIGRLILDAKQAPYDAAIRYSPASLAIGEYSSTKSPRYCSVPYLIAPITVYELEMTERMLTDLGLNWRYVTDAEIEADFLAENPSINLLFVPWGVCMNQAEAGAMQRFVERGGTLVSTGEFGLLNRQGLVHEQSLQQSLFGITTTRPKWLSSKATYAGPYACHPVPDSPLQLASVADQVQTVDAEVTATFADALPAITVRKLGTGRAVFLNTYLSNYKTYLPDPLPGPYHDPQAGRETMARAYRGVVRQAIGALAPLRAVHIDTPYYPEENAPYYRIGKFVGTDGATYYPLVQESFRTSYYVPDESQMRPGKGLECALRFDTEGHIYDARAQRYLGFGKEIKANIYPCEAKVYAILPYRVDALRLKVPRAVQRGEESAVTVAVSTAGRSKTRTNVHLQFYAPDGSEVRCYTQNLLIDGGKGHTTLRLALNDRPGLWRVLATETISGMRADAWLNVD
jgi:hypothetical protein